LKGVNIHVTDDVHFKLSCLKRSLGKSNLADVITSIIERSYGDLSISGMTKADLEKLGEDYDGNRGRER